MHSIIRIHHQFLTYTSLQFFLAEFSFLITVIMYLSIKSLITSVTCDS